jgi:hypothetical protein
MKKRKRTRMKRRRKKMRRREMGKERREKDLTQRHLLESPLSPPLLWRSPTNTDPPPST